jgi:hypothetical protein
MGIFSQLLARAVELESPSCPIHLEPEEIEFLMSRTDPFTEVVEVPWAEEPLPFPHTSPAARQPERR